MSYQDVEELLAERGITVDHVTIYRWVQRFIPLLIDAARPRRHARGDRWFVDETYVKIAGRWVYLYRAIDQCGQVIDVLVSEKRDLVATRRFFTHALEYGPCPTEVTTDRAPAYLRLLGVLLPCACHVVEQYANNPVESDCRYAPAPLHPLVLAADLVAVTMSRLAAGPPLAARSGLDIDGAAWTIPWTHEGLGLVYRPETRMNPWICGVCGGVVFIDHRARRPARASTVVRPRAASGMGRTAISHARAAVGGS